MSDNERERLLPAVPLGTGLEYGSQPEEAGEMAEDAKVGISTQYLVNENGAGGYGPGKKLMQYVAALAATLGALAAGTLLGWTSPATAARIKEDFGFEVSADDHGWIGSFVTLGAACICMPIGILMDKFGRKLTMLALVVPFTLGWALIVWAQNLEMMYVGRFITGIAGGAFCVTAPVYTGEIAQAEIRGALGSFFQLMLTVGILFVYALGVGVNVFILSLVCAIIPLIFGAVFFLMPESPAFLVSKGKSADARNALTRLRGDNYDVDNELHNIQRDYEISKQNAVSFSKAFTTRAAKKAMLISMMLMVIQQLSGINAVIFFTSDIFDSAGSSIPPGEATIIVGVMQVAATLVSTLIVDRLGRRILLLGSAALMAICSISLGVFFYLQEHKVLPENEINDLGWLPLTSLCIFIIAFSLGFGPIPWMILGELFPSEIKGIAGSIAGTFNWILAFIVTKTFVPLKTGIGSGETFWIYAAVCVLGTVFILLVVPETKGKSLQEIQIILGADPPPPTENRDDVK